jgi:hypothetical protein
MEMYLGDQIRNNEMGKVCGMPGGIEDFVQCLEGNPNESDHMEEVGACGRIIVK